MFIGSTLIGMLTLERQVFCWIWHVLLWHKRNCIFLVTRLGPGGTDLDAAVFLGPIPEAIVAPLPAVGWLVGWPIGWPVGRPRCWPIGSSIVVAIQQFLTSVVLKFGSATGVVAKDLSLKLLWTFSIPACGADRIWSSDSCEAVPAAMTLAISSDQLFNIF